MLDSDLAELYGVKTKALNRAVRRNMARFPADFMFQLTREESDLEVTIWDLKAGPRRTALSALGLYEAGCGDAVERAAQRAVQVNITIMRAFVKLREMLASRKDLARKLEALERKYDTQFELADGLSRIADRPERFVLSAGHKRSAICDKPERAKRRRIGFGGEEGRQR